MRWRRRFAQARGVVPWPGWGTGTGWTTTTSTTTTTTIDFRPRFHHIPPYARFTVAVVRTVYLQNIHPASHAVAPPLDILPQTP